MDTMHHRFAPRDRRVLLIGLVVALAGAAWIGSALGPLAVWPYACAVSMLTGLAVAPIGFAHGRGWSMVAAVLGTVVLGPFALVVLFAWMRTLPAVPGDEPA